MVLGMVTKLKEPPYTRLESHLAASMQIIQYGCRQKEMENALFLL